MWGRYSHQSFTQISAGGRTNINLRRNLNFGRSIQKETDLLQKVAAMFIS